MKNISLLEEELGISMKNQDLLRQALVHRSYINEHSDFELDHNERLEFLGDAVLEIIVTEYLYFTFPDKPEGELTNLRASLVNAKMLSQVASDLAIEENLYLSRGESRDNDSKARSFILADAVEAIIGALYLDGGMEAAKQFIASNVLTHLNEVLKNELYLDPKSKFQERAQEVYGVTPHYIVLSESGPDHAKVFHIAVFIGEEKIAEGTGTSKQEAQVAAAGAALEEKGW
ncbi:ribonuclease III [Candidatus Falkowbacteria bacterium RIFOXYC2_FULL_47_12]|uniref:Ribonuclease 3 n=2 Tax=Candidatus Falkowiibacteriota TaxID=1752728 RepID=A0A1F5TQK8_9BACT|nr:MAG: ribonuclease III [Candidatus Falkowbacteria bacterium RIFOXYA2_FULL_47_9]OGF41128.1 MAG: ribonuclease III [Candidatus Falkowbacteria bacterium RIFOXYC2_FULL_47_12]